jgi:hypothetical protein
MDGRDRRDGERIIGVENEHVGPHAATLTPPSANDDNTFLSSIHRVRTSLFEAPRAFLTIDDPARLWADSATPHGHAALA